MKSLKAVLLALLLGSVTFAQAQTTQTEVTIEKNQTITGKKIFTKGAALGPVTFANLGTLGSPDPGTVAVISDGSPGTVCSAGGTGVVAVYLGGTWNCSAGGGSANFASPPPLGNVTPNTVAASTVTVNGDGLFFQPQSNCIFEGTDPTLHEVEDVAGKLMWLYQGLGGPCTQILNYTPLPDGVNPTDKQVAAWDAASGAFTIQTQSGSGNPAFSALTSATNSTATMTVGTGASMKTSGTGSIQATGLPSSTVASLPINLPTNTLYEVTDAAQFGNCTTGGGTARALCRWNGASWESIGGSTATSAYYALANGLVCDNATDDTAALNTLTAAMNTAGGGTLIFPHGKTCRFSSAEITLPNNADTWTDSPGTISSQAPIHWTCDAQNVQYQQLMSTGATLAQIQNACMLDFRFNAADAKLVGLGMGHFEVDHLAFVDTNTDCAPFMLFTNTIPDLHDNAFIGSTASVNGGPYSCNDGILFGANGGTQPGKLVSNWFQGYAGAKIEHNFFNQIKRATVMQSAAQTIMILNNTVWSQSGNSTGGAFELTGAGVYGNTLSYNNVETVHYLYGINVASTAVDTLIVGQTCSDASEFVTLCVRSAGADVGTLIIGGTNQSATGSMLSPGDVNTSAFVLNTGSTTWKSTIKWNGFINLIEQTTPPVGTAATEALWGQSTFERPAFTKWHLSTPFHVAGTEEIPSTQTSIASDTFVRANAATLGANWTAINSLTSLQILTNAAATQATGAFEGNFYSNITFPADQWSQCTLGTVVSNSNNYVMCAVRIQSGAESFYSIMMSTDGSTFCKIRKFTAGATSDLASCASAGFTSNNPPVIGDVITITVVGTTITAYKNGIQLVTTTDSSFTSGSPGIVGFATSAASGIQYTAWSGGYMNCPTGVVTGLVLGSAATCTQSPALVGLTVSGGAVDASGATSIKLPVGAGFVTTAQGNMGYDSTALNWHVWQNAADRLMAVINGAVTNNDCAKFVVSGSTVSLQDAGACAGGTTTNPLTVNNSNSGAASGTTFDGSVARTISTNTIGAPNLGTANTFGAFLQDFTASTIKLPVAAGFTTTAQGNQGYDSTNLNWHIWQNGADRIAGVINGSTTNGDCSKFVVSGSTVSLQDSGAGCGPAPVSQMWLPSGTPNELPISPTTQTGQGVNTLGCIQFVPTSGITATKMSVSVNTVSAAQTFNVGIYDNSLNLVRDSGTFSCGTGGGLALSNTVSSFTLTPGSTYYACVAFSDTTCAIQGLAPTAGYANIANKNATRNFTCANALSAGAMPASCGTQTPVLGKEYIILLEQ